ncbi:MAG: DUF2225 domain-containing protein [Candidatus Thorarchaeota archaeon]
MLAYSGSMTTFSPISLNCPICGSEFESNAVASCSFASKRSDFRPNYWGASPVEFFYHVCPSCGFCGTQPAFDLTIENSEFIADLENWEISEIQTLSDKIERAMTFWELLTKHGVIDDDAFDLANGWVRAYWWAPDKGKEREYALKALDYFDKASKQHLVPPEQRATIEYLRGEINRRIKRKEEANAYFDKAMKLTEKGSQIHELAIRQKTAPEDNI